MNTFGETLIWNLALAAVCYGVIRLFDWKITPWLKKRQVEPADRA